LVSPDQSWLIQFVAGLLSVVLANLIQQIKNLPGDQAAITLGVPPSK
jgi:hypothetical protein